MPEFLKPAPVSSIEIEKTCPSVEHQLLEPHKTAWEGGTWRDRFMWCDTIESELDSCNADKTAATKKEVKE